MMQVTIQTAETNLSDLIERAQAGEDVVIAQGNTPVARLVPLRSSAFKIGLLKNELKGEGPDFFEPLSEADIRLWEGEA
jgi:prevent-host-death family protein